MKTYGMVLGSKKPCLIVMGDWHETILQPMSITIAKSPTIPFSIGFSNFPGFMVNLRYLPKSLISSWLGRFFSLIANQISVTEGLLKEFSHHASSARRPGQKRDREKPMGKFHGGIREQNHSQWPWLWQVTNISDWHVILKHPGMDHRSSSSWLTGNPTQRILEHSSCLYKWRF